MTVHSPRLQNFSGAGSVVLALIDFALNPVVPGLTSADPCVEWRELYPPYRFAAAAKTMANWKSDLEFQDPSHEITVHFQRMPTKRSGLRMGRVASRLSGLSTLRQAATVAMHLCRTHPGRLLPVRLTPARAPGTGRLHAHPLRRQFPERPGAQIHRPGPGHVVAVPCVPGEPGGVPVAAWNM